MSQASNAADPPASGTDGMTPGLCGAPEPQGGSLRGREQGPAPGSMGGAGPPAALSLLVCCAPERCVAWSKQEGAGHAAGPRRDGCCCPVDTGRVQTPDPALTLSPEIQSRDSAPHYLRGEETEGGRLACNPEVSPQAHAHSSKPRG